MIGKNWLLDTNVVIYLAKKELNLYDFVKVDDTLYISSITYMECLGFNFVNKKEERIMTQICNSLEQILISDNIIKTTILLRKNNKIKLPDAIIAASAIVAKAVLVTNNERDFINIKKLSLFNPIQS